MEPGPGISSRNIHNIKLGRELIEDGAYSRNCKVRKSLLQRFVGRNLQFLDLENTAKFG